MLTFIPLAHVDDILSWHDMHRDQRLAQHVLAEHVTHLIHGDAGLTSATLQTQMLFHPDSVDLTRLDADVLVSALQGITCVEMRMDAFVGMRVCDVMTSAGVFKSKGEHT